MSFEYLSIVINRYWHYLSTSNASTFFIQIYSPDGSCLEELEKYQIDKKAIPTRAITPRIFQNKGRIINRFES